MLCCSILKKDRYFTEQRGRQGPRSKAFAKLEQVKSEEGNEKWGQDKEQRDSWSNGNNGSEHPKYQCLPEQPLLVLQELTEGYRRNVNACDEQPYIYQTEVL